MSHVTTGLLIVILCFGVFVGYGLLNNRWYHVLAVEGGSMEPAIGWGDLIVITKPPEELRPGMIVTMQVKDKIVTHRVLEVDPLVTQGDANGVPDTWKPEDIRVVGVVQFRVPKLGTLLNAIRLGGSGSSAFFRDSDRVGGQVSAGHWEIVDEEVAGEAVGALNVQNTAPDTDLSGENSFDGSEAGEQNLRSTPVEESGAAPTSPSIKEGSSPTEGTSSTSTTTTMTEVDSAQLPAEGSQPSLENVDPQVTSPAEGSLGPVD